METSKIIQKHLNILIDHLNAQLAYYAQDGIIVDVRIVNDPGHAPRLELIENEHVHHLTGNTP